LTPTAKPAPITVVTNGVDLDYFAPDSSIQRDKYTVVFTGKMSYHANVTAVLFFVQQVLPLIWEKEPKVHFQIVGKDPPEAIRQLAEDPRIEVTGTVSDIRPYLADATVAVCPVRYAAGVQFKILEALAMDTPVVTTTAGAAGLAPHSRESVLVAANEKEMSLQVLQVLLQPQLAEKMVENGRRYVEEHHSWVAGAKQLTQVYLQEIMASPQPSAVAQ
jgi:glycosyltransferase involved in cell wall biosynthesis